ncbi:MAG: hypothetical protein RL026_1089 [Pseudomonadota bacterium]|jgi:hypothetical protein
MDTLYSLYDALVSINVPTERARAVVGALEKDMGSLIASKADLKLVEQSIRSEIALQRKDMELLVSRQTWVLGSLLTVGIGLLYTLLRFT